MNGEKLGERLRRNSGREVSVSEWMTITRERILAFAECTEDRQWIHVDEERARRSRLGTTVAHGYLLLSLLPRFHEAVFPPDEVNMKVNYGLDRVRFISPVPAGARIRNRTVIMEVSDKSSGLLVKTVNTVEIEGGTRPALVAEALHLLVGA